MAKVTEIPQGYTKFAPVRLPVAVINELIPEFQLGNLHLFVNGQIINQSDMVGREWMGPAGEKMKFGVRFREKDGSTAYFTEPGDKASYLSMGNNSAHQLATGTYSSTTSLPVHIETNANGGSTPVPSVEFGVFLDDAWLDNTIDPEGFLSAAAADNYPYAELIENVLG